MDFVGEKGSVIHSAVVVNSLSLSLVPNVAASGVLGVYMECLEQDDKWRGTG